MDCFVAFAPRNDDGDKKRKCQKQPTQLESPRGNACAAASALRSIRLRAGPGTIIRLAAGAHMAPPTPPMSEAGASGSALPGAKPALPASRTKPQKPCEAFARDAARRCFTNARARRTW